MKQVKQRTLLLLLLAAGFAAGVVLFCVFYATKGGQWAAFSANDHVYKDGRLAVGQILDRNGVTLYDGATGDYAEERSVRKATLHAVGDRWDNIATSAKAAFDGHLVGFNVLTGTTTGGSHLYLTIDSELNRQAWDLLDGRKGAVGIYNYKTGEVLCMVSTPTFDPADPPTIQDGDSRYDGVYINRLLSATFTPGSVFKVVTTAAVIETLPDWESRTFHCDGRYDLGDFTITCPYAHGDMTLRDAFAKSCNCAYAQLAVELGGGTLERYAKKAGLLDSISVSGLHTAQGSFTAAEDQGLLGWSGVGQHEDLVCPANLMTLMGAIANGGRPVLPHLIYKETDLAGLTLYRDGTGHGSRTFSRATCETLKEMMANNVAVTYGQENFGDLKLCAKSGTAEVGDASPHAWFAGFLDDADHPLAFVVFVENGGGGASAAGPIASALLQAATAEKAEETS